MEREGWVTRHQIAKKDDKFTIYYPTNIIKNRSK
jgi:hypothetical protein